MLQHKEVAALQKQTGNNPLKDFTSLDAKSLAQQQTPALSPTTLSEPATAREAIDHFADHQDVLKKAKGDLSKYKGRFDKIKSVKELPNNPLRRHSLMGVKWYKRIQPGLQWQLGSGNSFRVDLGPRASYLLTDRLELGATAQLRTSVGKAVPGGVSFSYDKIWGYSLFASYELKKSFYGQLGFERLNTQKKMLPGQQELPTERIWVEGLRLGIGRRFTLYKYLKGYSLIEYNFSPSIHTPYHRQLQAKLGIMWDKRGR